MNPYTGKKLGTKGLNQGSPKPHSIKGYTTKNGTYVSPHQATNPDGAKANNWSTEGNVNRYTGKPGTKDPYQASPH